jgi:hypothetical protein
MDVERVVAQQLPCGLQQSRRQRARPEQRRGRRTIGLVDAVDGLRDPAVALAHEVVGVDLLDALELPLHGRDLLRGEQPLEDQEPVAVVRGDLLGRQLHGHSSWPVCGLAFWQVNGMSVQFQIATPRMRLAAGTRATRPIATVPPTPATSTARTRSGRR